jgi:hypothetical protein
MQKDAPPTDSELMQRGLGFHPVPPAIVAEELNAQVVALRTGMTPRRTVPLKPPDDVRVLVASARAEAERIRNTPRSSHSPQHDYAESHNPYIIASTKTSPTNYGNGPTNGNVPKPLDVPQSGFDGSVSGLGNLSNLPGGAGSGNMGPQRSVLPHERPGMGMGPPGSSALGPPPIPTNAYSLGALPRGVAWRYVDIMAQPHQSDGDARK